MFPFRLLPSRPVARLLVTALVVFVVLGLRGLGGSSSARAQGVQIPETAPSFGPPVADTGQVVTGMPYETERTLHTKRSLADGTISNLDTSIREARDSSGRIVQETQSEVPAAAGRPARELVFVSVSDLAARTLLTWTNLTKEGALIHLPPAPPLNGRPQQTPEEGAVSLGHRMIQGLVCSGYSVKTTIPAGAMGNATPITTRHEWWINDELHVKALEIFNDPQRGERTFELVSIKRGEPDTERFHVPSGYEVHDVRAPGTAPDAPHAGDALDLEHAPAVSHEQAVSMLDSQDRQRQLGGAAALLKEAQASDDPIVKDDVAYQLAKANIALAEAHTLADFAVTSAERDSAGESAPLTQRAQFAIQIELARRWDTLGYIYYRQGNSTTASSYIDSAFKLDPRAYYGAHLAKILEQDGETEKAVALYRSTLQASGSEQIKGTIQERVKALAGDSGKPASAEEEKLADTDSLAGSAFFDIVYSSGAPTAAFVSGEEALRALVPALTSQKGPSFTLPDAGPEHVVRRVEVTCSAQAGSNSDCRIRVLGALEARNLAGRK